MQKKLKNKAAKKVAVAATPLAVRIKSYENYWYYRMFHKIY